MRSTEEIEARLKELERGVRYWRAEARGASDREYRAYANRLVRLNRREIAVLRWVLGEHDDLPPAE